MESGEDDSSPEAYIQSLKTSRDPDLDPELFITVEIFEFCLVTQSLQSKILKGVFLCIVRHPYSKSSDVPCHFI